MDEQDRVNTKFNTNQNIETQVQNRQSHNQFRVLSTTTTKVNKLKYTATKNHMQNEMKQRHEGQQNNRGFEYPEVMHGE